MQNLRFKPIERLFIFLVCLVIFALIGSIIVGFIVKGGITTKTLRIATVIQDCIIFILPAIVTAIIISPLPVRFLKIESSVHLSPLIWAILAIIVSIPLMNWIVLANESIQFPESFSGLEAWMRIHENEAQASVKILLGDHSISSLCINLLLVGILAGFSEEIIFRGTLQQIFYTAKMNSHLAIWLTAFIFSAIHMQFFGFIPRLLLGAYFGYLVFWSGSLWLPIIMHALNNSIVVYSSWLHEIGEGSEGDNTLNQFGATSPVLIICSAILTIFVLKQLKQACQNTPNELNMIKNI